MSGDYGLRINLPASLQALRADTRLPLLSNGREEAKGNGQIQRARQLASADERLNWRILAMLSRATLRELRAEMNPELHSGAFLLGLQGVVVKSHGASSQHSFSAALQQAARCVQHQMVSQMAHYLDEKS